MPLHDPLGNYYETGSPKPLPAQSAVRTIGEVDYHRILAAAGVASTGISRLPSTEEIARISYLGPPAAYPKDKLRIALEIPPALGTVPKVAKS